MADESENRGPAGPPTEPSLGVIDPSTPAASPTAGPVQADAPGLATPSSPLPAPGVDAPRASWDDITEVPGAPTWPDDTEIPGAAPVGPSVAGAAGPSFTPPPVPPAVAPTPSTPAANPPGLARSGPSFAPPPSPPGPPGGGPGVPGAWTGPVAHVPRRRRGGFFLGALIGGLVGALVASGIYLAVREDSPRVVQRGPSLELAGEPTDIAGVLARVQPAVVAIRTGGAVDGGSGRGGAGSGFVITEDGYIATNNHVVQDANGSISVTFDDGTTREAELIGADPYEDLAIVKVDATGLPTAKLGSSNVLQVGDDVVAIGNALALEGGPSVTTGIVSGLDRSIPTNGGPVLSDVIQTDAAINQGNSGGPLVNAAGEVIGINTAVADPGYAQNVGFAIAIDHAKPILESLRKGETAKQAFLGVESVDVTPTIRNERNLTVDSGAVIRRVVPGSAAEDAGLQVGDVIVAIDDEPVDGSASVSAEVRSHRPGDEITITVVRDNRERAIEVTLGER